MNMMARELRPYTWDSKIRISIFAAAGNSVQINYKNKPCMLIRVNDYENMDDKEAIILYVEDLVRQLNRPHYLLALESGKNDQQILDDSAIVESQDSGENE